MLKHLASSTLCVLFLTVLLGIVYPFAITVIARTLFPYQADGSLVMHNNIPIGSPLIGQNFGKPGYFHPRPSAAGNGYDASLSGGSNLGPTSKKLMTAIQERLQAILKENPGIKISEVPVDAVTASASGLDPHISPAYAYLQVSRVAKARGLHGDVVRNLVERYTQKQMFGFLSEPRVNVLELNFALDAFHQKRLP